MCMPVCTIRIISKINHQVHCSSPGILRVILDSKIVINKVQHYPQEPETMTIKQMFSFSGPRKTYKGMNEDCFTSSTFLKKKRRVERKKQLAQIIKTRNTAYR